MPNPLPFLIGGFIAALIVTPLVRTVALRPHRFGRPRDGGAAATPAFGGIAILVASLTALPFLLTLFPVGLWAGAVSMALIGLVDDLRPLSPRHKLGLQIAAAGAAVILGVRIQATGMFPTDCVITVLWLVWMSNAFNVLDMMDGLAAGVGSVAALGLAVLAVIGGTTPTVIMGATLAGGLVGFLVHNRHPARIYMGDTGSLFAGFLLGALAVEVSGVFPMPHAAICSLLVLGVPCFEGAFLCAVRKAQGRPIVQASRDHTAQRLVRMGCSVHGTVARMYVAGGVLAAGAALGAVSPAPVCWAVLGGAVLAALWAGWWLARVDAEEGRPGKRTQGVFSKNWAVHGLMRRAMESEASRAAGRLLDVGCGDRPYEGVFRSRVDSYVGLEIGRERYKDPCVAAWGDAAALPFRSDSFDTVLCNQVLEHVPEPGRAVGEMARVLKPGGHLILTAPHIWGIQEEPHDYYRFTPYGLRYLGERAGLEVVAVRPLAGFWVTMGARLCYYLEHFERGPIAIPVRLGYLLVQACALLLDRLHRVEGDAWNHLMVARKRF